MTSMKMEKVLTSHGLKNLFNVWTKTEKIQLNVSEGFCKFWSNNKLNALHDMVNPGKR